jgi:hypothetical protein
MMPGRRQNRVFFPERTVLMTLKPMAFLTMAVLVLAAMAPAAPLRQAHIPAEARWVFHLDLDAFGDSDLGKLVLTEVRAAYGPKIEAMAQLLGSDLLADLNGVTLFGTDAGEENATALFYGSHNPDKLTALLLLNGAYHKSDYQGQTLHHWVEEKHQKNQVGAFAAPDLIVIAQQEAPVQAALDVLAGRSTSLAAAPASPLKGLTVAPDQTMALAAATGLSGLTAGHQQAAILGNSKMMALIIAEAQGQMKLQVDLVAETVEAAAQIEQVINGMKAFILLRQNDFSALPAIIRQSSLRRMENQLSLESTYPSAALFDSFKMLWENKNSGDEAADKAAPQPDPATD